MFRLTAFSASRTRQLGAQLVVRLLLRLFDKRAPALPPSFPPAAAWRARLAAALTSLLEVAVDRVQLAVELTRPAPRGWCPYDPSACGSASAAGSGSAAGASVPGFHHVDQLNQQGADRQRFVLQQGHCAAAGVAGQDQIRAVADDRVLPADELRVFARQRPIAVEGDGAAVLRQPGKSGTSM